MYFIEALLDNFMQPFLFPLFIDGIQSPTLNGGLSIIEGFSLAYGRIISYSRVACRNPHNQHDWGVGISVKFNNGSICGFISKNGSAIEWGSFEAGYTTWNGASPDGYGNLMNCTAKDVSTAMKWRRSDTTINMISYTDATLMGFNNGNNTVFTSLFPGYIEDKDGGAYQVLTIQISGRSLKYMYPREYSPVVQTDQTLWILYNSFTYFMKY